MMGRASSSRGHVPRRREPGSAGERDGDLTGDQRDEIVLWDQKRVWIYTQDRPFHGEKIYAPIRNPDYNESNYRTNVSLPNWGLTRVRSAN